MKKFLLLGAFIFGFILYVFHQNKKENLVTPSNNQPASSSSPNNPNSAAGSTSRSPGTAYKDGSYVGDAVDAYYGNVQVKAIVTGGRVADVQFLQYPNDRQNSVYINSQAMPYLTREAISAQSAQVDIVSGATDTSIAFERSLSLALSQAQ